MKSGDELTLVLESCGRRVERHVRWQQRSDLRIELRHRRNLRRDRIRRRRPWWSGCWPRRRCWCDGFWSTMRRGRARVATLRIRREGSGGERRYGRGHEKYEFERHQ